MKQNESKARTIENECYTCVHRKPILGSTLSKCMNGDSQIAVHFYNIENGRFNYPINFDPALKKLFCCNYIEKRLDIMEDKLYGNRDIEEQGETYFKHISAMTREQLHSKSDIAAELAHRDILINELKEVNAALLKACMKYEEAIVFVAETVKEWKGDKL